MESSTLSKQITRTGKLSKLGQLDINKYLESKEISVHYLECNNPYELFYTVESLYDCIKLLQFSYTIDHFNLIANQSKFTNLPAINLTYFDKIGEDSYSGNNFSDTASYIVNNQDSEGRNTFNVIVGNGREGVVDSLTKIVDLVLKQHTTNYKEELTLGLFLGQINPNKYLNRSFKLHRLKDLYTAFVNVYNKYRHSRRLLIELSRGLLSFTTKPSNIKLTYNSSIYQSFKVNTRTVKQKILEDKYLALYKHLIRRVNIDLPIDSNQILDKLISNSEATTPAEDILHKLYLNNYNGNNIIYLTSNATLITKKGLISAKKLLRSSLTVWTGTKWSYARIEEVKEHRLIYLVIFTDGSSIEVFEDTKFKLVDGTERDLRELQVGDQLKVAGIPPYYLEHNLEIFCSNGIVSSVVFNHSENKLIKLSISNNVSNTISSGNCLYLESAVTEQESLTPLQIKTRLSDNYSESTSLVKDSIVLESRVNLEELNLLNITDQLKIFRTATLISGSSLNLSEHRMCVKLTDNLLFNPTINVSVFGIQRFNHNLYKLCRKNSKLTLADDNGLLTSLLDELTTNSLSNLDFNYQRDTNQITLTGNPKVKYTYLLKALLLLWKSEVNNTITEYCTKHNLTTPKKTTSVIENEIFEYDVREQLELILTFHKYYSTQNSIFTVNYKKEELNKLTNKITNLIKTNQDLPYLIFNQIG